MGMRPWERFVVIASCPFPAALVSSGLSVFKCGLDQQESHGAAFRIRLEQQ